MKRLRNSSGIPDALVREVVDWIAADLGIAGFDVECRSTAYSLAGRAYNRGSHYHTSARPFVVLRIGAELRKRYKSVPWDGSNVSHAWETTPSGEIVNSTMQVRDGWKPSWPIRIPLYQYAQHKGHSVVLAHRIEGLVYLAAHELRHIWQSGGPNRTQRRGYYPNSRGRYSEVDTEAYALHMLRAWRKRGL